MPQATSEIVHHNNNHHQLQRSNNTSSNNDTTIDDANYKNGGTTSPGSRSPGSQHSSNTSTAILEEIFYISSKRNTLYRVRLTEKCLSLRKESNCGPCKTETILVNDIVGCRCMRSKRRSAGSCACGPGASRGQPRLVDSNEPIQPHDEYDTSAYLYIYAYTLKTRNNRSNNNNNNSNSNSSKNGERSTTTTTINKRRERMTVTLRFRSFDRYEDNLREASRWRLAIKCLVNGLPVPRAHMSPAHRNLQSLLSACPNESRKLLVLLNPKSGPGRGRESFQRRVHPVLAEAELACDVFITRHSNYARDFVRSRDLSQWSGIVLVGGDGIVYEVVNGILQRPDWQDRLEELPIAVIPCGSGNGLAKSIAFSRQECFDHNPILISTLSVVRRNVSRMDLVRVETRKQTVFSFLSVGWGFIADIDIESERLRAIGYPRFTIWSVARLIGLRTYRGTVSYLPCNNQNSNNDMTINQNGMVNGNKNNSNGEHRLDDVKRIGHSKSCADELDRYTNDMRESKSYDDTFDGEDVIDVDDFRDLDEDNNSQIIGESLQLETETAGEQTAKGRRPRLDSFFSAKSRKSAYFSTGSGSISSAYHSVQDLGTPTSNGDGNNTGNPIVYGPPSTMPALTTKVPSSWTRVEGEFVMVQASYQSHLARDCYFVPQAKLADGIIWLLIIRAGISRTNLLQFLLSMSAGTHLSCPGVEMIPVKAFRIEPADNTTGLLTVDGEKVDYGPLQAEIFPSLATVMCP